MRILTVEEKMCWIVLLCLANSEDKGGEILYVNEDEVLKQANIEENSQAWKETKGFLDKFVELKMITITVTKVTRGVTRSNKALRYDIKLCNFEQRQTENLSNAERQKRHRERLKTKTLKSNDSNATQSNVRNARIEESRVDNTIPIATKVAKGVKKTPKKEIAIIDVSEEWNFDDELKKMLKPESRRDIKIIARYWQEKNFRFENKLQYTAQLGRDLAAAKKLLGYTGPQIVAAMNHSKAKYEEWTLETVCKRIADVANTKT